jgi:TolB-like protein
VKAAGRLVPRRAVVVSTELVDVGTGAMLWGEQYDRTSPTSVLRKRSSAGYPTA